MALADLRDQLQAALGDAYHLERELAPGGMSRLFLATERSLDRPVVVKVLPPEYASEVSAARFQREVTLTAHLQHPHILPILSAGSKNGLLYYVMPYVEGESLRKRIEREGRLPVDSAIQILREVADALARAHRAGIVHRDIKPENILLQDDHALLADFGVARALHEATGSQRLTDTGMGLGTPGYMAPEQLAGERNVDARADVYALAAVGYEMLAGEPPFGGATPQAVAAARFTSSPKPIRQLRPEVPLSVSAAIGQALSTEPGDRFASAGAFRDHLLAPQRRATSTLRLAATAVLVLAVAGGGVLAWARTQGTASPGPVTGPVRVAVLPFDNLGDSADAYFADGVTDAVRDKLAAVPGLEVIASASSGQYRRTRKAPPEIGRELGVRYLLTGNVRWVKQPGGVSRVQVRPELVDAVSTADKWGEPFDAPLTDVFQVQATIAEDVVRALQVALTPAGKDALRTRPTQNLQSYEAYLRGLEIHRTGGFGGYEHAAIASFEDAVRGDSTFALAWAAMAESYAWKFDVNYSGSPPEPGDAAAARASLDRARALAPRGLEVLEAESKYEDAVHHDPQQALEILSRALEEAPTNPEVLSRLATLEQRLGQWEISTIHYQQAARLDPQHPGLANSVAANLIWLRRYAEARAALARAPATDVWNLYLNVLARVAEGDLTAARVVMQSAPIPVDSTNLAFIAGELDLFWALDSTETDRLLHLSLAVWNNDRKQRAFEFAEVYALRGDVVRARAYADTARNGFEAALRTDTANLDRGYNAVALAYLGEHDAAIGEGKRAVAQHRDAYAGVYMQYTLARVYVLVGEFDRALDELELLLSRPGFVSPGWLRIDPNFAPLRGNPRFQPLIADTTAVRPS